MAVKSYWRGSRIFHMLPQCQHSTLQLIHSSPYCSDIDDSFLRKRFVDFIRAHRVGIYMFELIHTKKKCDELNGLVIFH